MSDTYKILKTVNMFNINTDPYISYWKEWNDVYWYQRTQQKYINTPEGNIEVSTGRKMSFSYCYTSKDHLGSIWLYWNSLNNSRANIYYPSGIMREKRRSPFNYGLTGKEIVYDNGLDEYFFGARTLFAPINRFNQPDPLCEEYYHISPYAYCANNFINALDPDGLVINAVHLGLPLGNDLLDGLEKEFLEQEYLEQQIADLRNGRPRRKLHEGLKIHAAVLLPIGLDMRLQKLREQARCNEDQKQTNDEAVNTGRLRAGDAKEHGRSEFALHFRLTGHSLDCLTGNVAFADAGAEAGDHRNAGADGAAHENQSLCKFHVFFPPVKYVLIYLFYIYFLIP